MLPDPTPTEEPAESSHRPQKPRRGTRDLLVVLLILVSGALLGYAAFVGVGHFLGGDDTPVAETQTVALPASAAGFVRASGPAANAALVAMFGMGARPAGVTATAAYGPRADGDVLAGALATTIVRPTAAAQFDQFAKRTGAKVGSPEVGMGTQSGISCATAGKSADLAAGSICVWDSGIARGQAYFVDAKPAQAIAATGKLIAAMSAVPAT